MLFRLSGYFAVFTERHFSKNCKVSSVIEKTNILAFLITDETQISAWQVLVINGI